MSWFDFGGPPPGYVPGWLDRHQIVALFLFYVVGPVVFWGVAVARVMLMKAVL